MPEIVLYEAIQHICFKISGKNLSAKMVNPIIKNFHDKLNDFYYESHPFKIVPVAVDEFKIREIDTSKIIGSYQIRWDVIDMVKEDAMFRKNNEIQPLITRLVKKIGVGIGTEDSRIIIKVINSRFNDEFKEGVWPDNPNAMTL